jgi:quercetin dioxygenase-like cupin family protein
MPANSMPSSRSVSVVGDRYTLVVTGEETSGAFAMMDFHVPVNHGPPPHVHSREEETFYVLEGEFEFTVAGQKQRLVKGQSLVAPRHVPHTFRNAGPDMGRMIVIITPAGLEKFFIEIGVPLPSDASPPIEATAADIKRLQEAAPRYGLTLLPPPAQENASA